MTIAYISHPECLLHEMGPHPEQPARLNAIADRLIACGLDAVLRHHEAPQVSRSLLEQVHDPAYVQSLFAAAPTSGYHPLDPDTSMNPHSLPAALRAAGAAQLGVDLVMSGEVDRAFCAVRPPGHHAERDRAMGFCLFNNVVVGAYHALGHYGLERVAILDFDVHHGNGTEHIVQGDERILFCSTFQHPFYPHTGDTCRAGNVINTPLPAGTGSEGFRRAVEDHWLGPLADFAPQLILVSAGFDAHQADDMAGLNLVDTDYHWITRRICEQAETSAAGRVVSCLEGGYELHALARSVEAHLKAFLGAT
ncbi:histone deacetylase family protein [Parahaliea mediterranea]|uniref:Histone deacetylase family protein n=1 Tax=Parahaliea mediterranea TaxID=651086 RepID=A0A939DBZ8_9GAMM|nr:histone deacetylase family protein [Parahaliea mediterranea]MBN7795234.1 histone deacetylase family protein [Parahaliea mediterranea]